MTDESETPSMGPVLFPEYSSNVILDDVNYHKNYKKNYKKIFTYIFSKRLKEIKKNPNNPISELEFNDLIKLGKLSAEYVYDNEIIKKETYDKALNLIKEANIIYKTANKINDIPESKIIDNGFHIESSRYEMRKSLNGLHDSIIDVIDTMNYRINNNFENLGSENINKGTIELALNKKKTIDELIKLKIFRKSEIYSIIFQNENIWDDIKLLYMKYNRLLTKYKKNNK
jgi:hypothetical protein